MKTQNIILITAIALIVVSPASYAEDYMNKEQRQTTFCGKTFDGEILSTGATFQVHIDSECKSLTIHFRTGIRAGESGERIFIRLS